MRYLALISFGVLGLLAACGGTAAPSRVTEPVYSTRVTGSDLTAANADATAYCRRTYNTSAELVSVAPGVANYHCITAATPNLNSGAIQAPQATTGAIAVPVR